MAWGRPGTWGGCTASNRPIGSAYCTAAPSSTSPGGARLSAFGSTELALDHLVLRAEGLPWQPALFFYGNEERQQPFGDGVRCVGGHLGRLPIAVAAGGRLQQEVDLALYGGAFATIGTVHFQTWYRDPDAGGAGFNLSDARTIVFQP